MCNSLLIEESLKIFLHRYSTNYKNCDFVVSDHFLEIQKPLFVISNDDASQLKLPFTSSKLLIEVEKFYKQGKTIQNTNNVEERIDELLREYTHKLIEILKPS